MRTLLLTFCLLFTCSSYAATEGQWTHGGDPVLASVHSEIRSLGKKLEELPQLSYPYQDLALRYMQAYQSLILQIKPGLEWRGQEVTAINSPYGNPQILEISEKRWSELSSREKETLLLHEFMFLMGIDDTSYLHSQFIHQSLTFIREGDLKELIKAALDNNQLYLNISSWTLFFNKAPISAFAGEPALQYVVSQYVDSLDWLRLFEGVLKFVPLKKCNRIASQSLLELMFVEENMAKLAQDRMIKRGFRLNPSIVTSPDLCAE